MKRREAEKRHAAQPHLQTKEARENQPALEQKLHERKSEQKISKPRTTNVLNQSHTSEGSQGTRQQNEDQGAYHDSNLYQTGNYKDKPQESRKGESYLVSHGEAHEICTREKKQKPEKKRTTGRRSEAVLKLQSILSHQI